MASFYYLSPANQVSLFAGVTATLDSDYTPAWLCDGRARRPVRSTNTSLSATIAPLVAGTVSFVAVCHHNLSVNASFGGDITATVAAGALQDDGTRLNGFTTIAPVAGVDSVTLTVTSNGATVVLGEVFFGSHTTLSLPFYRDNGFEEEDAARPPENDLSDIPGYDTGEGVGRVWTATWPVLTQAELDGLRACRTAQRNRTRPTVIVPNTSVNDAWVCFITKISYKPGNTPNKWQVSATFEEVAQVRW